MQECPSVWKNVLSSCTGHGLRHQGTGEQDISPASKWESPSLEIPPRSRVWLLAPEAQNPNWGRTPKTKPFVWQRLTLTTGHTTAPILCGLINENCHKLRASQAGKTSTSSVYGDVWLHEGLSSSMPPSQMHPSGWGAGSAGQTTPHIPVFGVPLRTGKKYSKFMASNATCPGQSSDGHSLLVSYYTSHYFLIGTFCIAVPLIRIQEPGRQPVASGDKAHLCFGPLCGHPIV